MNKRKDQAELLKRKPTQKQQQPDYTYDEEISILIPFLKIMTPSIQSKFVIPLKQVSAREPVSQLNNINMEKMFASYPTAEISDCSKNAFLTQLFCRFLGFKKLKFTYDNTRKKQMIKQKQNDIAHQKNNQTSTLQSFEPNIQRQNVKFDPIQTIINPNYETIVKMYRTFTDVHINMEYKIKDVNQNYTFFSQPRLVSKILQMRDFESSFPEKGNIIMMSFEGTKIVGKRGFAFINGNAIYWWEKNYKDMKDILPQIGEQKEGKDSKKKDYQKQQIKNQTQQPSKLIQNFKLSYKMIGHSGKITSISLSDDEYYLISSGADKSIKLWDLRQKCLLAEYRGHMKIVWSVDFCKSGYFFLSGSGDRTIKLWSTDDSICQKVYLGHQDDVIKVEFLRNPDLIASGSEDKTIKIWNTLTAECINTLRLDKSLINFKNSISGRYFAACDTMGKISVFDLLKGELISSFMVPEKPQSSAGSANYLKIHNMCFSMDEKQFTCISSKYIIVYSFDKISEKQSKNLFIDSGKQSKEKTIATKQVIYTGRDTNLVYCDYHDKGILLVATTSSKKY